MNGGTSTSAKDALCRPVVVHHADDMRNAPAGSRQRHADEELDVLQALTRRAAHACPGTPLRDFGGYYIPPATQPPGGGPAQLIPGSGKAGFVADRRTLAARFELPASDTSAGADGRLARAAIVEMAWPVRDGWVDDTLLTGGVASTAGRGRDQPADHQHAMLTLGLFRARRATLDDGVRDYHLHGIAPCASLALLSEQAEPGASFPDGCFVRREAAIARAAARLRPGDVLLLEMQSVIDLGSAGQPVWREVLPEWDAATRQAIRCAALAGIVVVEPAGNDDYDVASVLPPDALAPGDPEHSGALLVTGPTGYGHGVGSRVDLHGPDAGVATTAGDGRPGEHSGTSLAAGAIAAALCLLQSHVRAQRDGACLAPAQLRSLLTHAGPPPGGSEPMGVAKEGLGTGPIFGRWLREVPRLPSLHATARTHRVDPTLTLRRVVLRVVNPGAWKATGLRARVYLGGRTGSGEPRGWLPAADEHDAPLPPLLGPDLPGGGWLTWELPLWLPRHVAVAVKVWWERSEPPWHPDGLTRAEALPWGDVAFLLE